MCIGVNSYGFLLERQSCRRLCTRTVMYSYGLDKTGVLYKSALDGLGVGFDFVQMKFILLTYRQALLAVHATEEDGIDFGFCSNSFDQILSLDP